METSERIAYLKGLVEGLGITSDTKEGKVIEAVIAVLDDIALDISDMEDSMDMLTEQIESMDEDLDGLMADVYEDDECDEDDYEGDLYEVTCPKCGDVICVDEDMLDQGEIDCPGCGETLEFDFDGALEDCSCGGCACRDDAGEKKE